MQDARPWQSRLPFFYGWIIVALGFVFSFFGIGLTWAAGLLAVPMGAELGWSRSAIFFALSLRGWMAIVVAPVIGPYLDRRNGPRALVVSGGLLNAVTLLLTPFIDAEWQFIALFGVFGGIAQAFQGGISFAIVPKWFIQRRGSAVSIATLGGGVSALLLPTFIGGFSNLAGWRLCWTILGVLAFALGAVPATLLRRQPEDIGLLPDGEAVSLRADERVANRPTEESSFTLNEALHTSAFWVLMLGLSIGSISNNGLPATLAAIFVDRGFPLEVAATALTLYGVASIVAKMAWGRIAGRFSLRVMLLGLTLFGSLTVPVIVLLPRDLGPVSLGYGFLVGLYVGAYVFLSQLVWADYFGRAHVGAISSLGRPLGIIIGSAGPFLMAFTRDLTGSYDLSIMLNAAGAALCFGCLLLVRPAHQLIQQPTPAVTARPPASRY